MSALRMGTKKYKSFEESCDFIRMEMQFYSFEDFRSDAEAIKRLYKSANPVTKQLYKWYVYSRNISYGQKNQIWDYLNNPITLEKLTK